MEHDKIKKNYQDRVRRERGRDSSQNPTERQANITAIVQRPVIEPYSLTVADVMQLQKTLGNEAMGRDETQSADDSKRSRLQFSNDIGNTQFKIVFSRPTLKGVGM